MSRVRRWALWVGAANLMAAGALALLAALVIDRQPAFVQTEPLSPLVMDDVVRSLRAAWPAGGMLAGAKPQPVVLAASTLDAVVADVAHRRLHAAGARVRVDDQVLSLGLSVPVAGLLGRPGLDWAGWLNLGATLTPRAQGLPSLARVSCGALNVPVPESVQVFLLKQARSRPELQRARLVSQAIQRVSFQPDALTLHLHAPQDLAQRLRAQALPGLQLPALQRHHQHLAQLLAQPGMAGAGSVPVSRLLGPMWQFAVQQAGAPPPQTQPAGATAPPALVREYRLALLALGLYAFHIEPALLAPEWAWASLPRRELVLRGRADHALHFLTSALLAMGGDVGLADLLGLYKELADAGGVQGSGFSFDDLVADRAGAELGRRAATHPQALAQRLNQPWDDAFLMPPTADLPTGLRADEFARRFGRVGSAAYLELMDEVERRVVALPVLR